MDVLSLHFVERQDGSSGALLPPPRRNDTAGQLQYITSRQNHGPLDNVFQLADIARPVVRIQSLQDTVGHGLDPFPQPGRQLGEKEANECGDVFQSLA